MSITAGAIVDLQALSLPLHRFSVEEYHRLGELGILKPEDRVELLEGWIVEKMNHRPAHGFAVQELNDWFVKHIPSAWFCRCQLPVTLAASEPEPDLAIVWGNRAEFRSKHPGGEDCRLVIEVADTSLVRDRAKAIIYAIAGVPEFWIVNVAQSQVERLTSPGPQGYRDARTYNTLQLIEFELGSTRLAFPVQALFGPNV